MVSSHLYGDNDAQSQRRKREEQQVELRRQRTEELLNKKRESNKENSTLNSFESAKNLLYSNKISDICKGAYDCRSLLSVENNPPIQEIITSGVVSRFVELLDADFYSAFGQDPLCNKCRFEAAWVLTNIASGNSEQTKYLVDKGAVPFLVKMMSESDDMIVDQAIWALGNIAGDSEALRDVILMTNALQIIFGLINHYSTLPAHIKILRNLVWLLSNLNRGRNPLPSLENMLITLNAIQNVIQIDDSEVISDCFWGVSYIADAYSQISDMVIQSPIMTRCHDVLSAFVNELQGQPFDRNLSLIGAHAISPIVRALGNIASGNEEQTDSIVRMGFLDMLYVVFYKFKNKKLPRLRKEICWLLSNVTAGTEAQLRYVLDGNLASLLIDALSSYELFIRKEASYALLNMLFHCTKHPECLKRLLDLQLLLALQQYLDAINNVPEAQSIVLDTTKYALEAGEKLKMKYGTNPVIQEMIDSKFVDSIEELQDVKNNTVAQKAYHIIVNFFEGEEEQ